MSPAVGTPCRRRERRITARREGDRRRRDRRTDASASTEAPSIARELLAIATELRALRAELKAAKDPREVPALLSKAAAAKLLGVDRKRTLQRLINDGKLRLVNVGGAHCKVPLADIQRLAIEGSHAVVPRRYRAQIAPRTFKTRAEIEAGLRERGW